MIVVKDLELTQIPQLVEFYRETYPERSNVLDEYVYRIAQLPSHLDDISKNKLAVDDEKIVAANMMLPFKMNLNKDGVKSYLWSFDTVVSENYQNTDAGVLMLEVVLSKKWWFGIGLSDIACILHKKIKSNFIGKKRRFVYVNFRNVFNLRIFLRLLKIIKSERKGGYLFPDSVRIKDFSFVKIENPEHLKTPFDGVWNKEAIEPLRDRDFLTRRFFRFPKPYIFYQSESKSRQGDFYFVVCPIRYKNTHLLLVVDFRSKISNPEDLKKIILAGKQLTKQLKFDGLIFETSVSSYQKPLKKLALFPISAAEIVTNYKKINAEDIVNFTTADSDGDFHLQSL